MNTIAKAGMKLLCLIRHELGTTSPESSQKLERALDDLLYQVGQEIDKPDQAECLCLAGQGADTAM